MGFQSILNWLASAESELLKAGFAGSAVSVAMEWTGVRSAIRRMVVGTISAVYMSPLAIPIITKALDLINVPQMNAPSVSGFLMGVSGIIVIEIILNSLRAWSKQPKINDNQKRGMLEDEE